MGAALTLEPSGLENLWRRPPEYRQVPASHSAPRVPGPWATFRHSLSLRLPASLGPKLGPTTGPRRLSPGPPRAHGHLPHRDRDRGARPGSRSSDAAVMVFARTWRKRPAPNAV